VPQLKICDFSGETFLKCYNFLWVQRRHNGCPAASFAKYVMTLHLLKVHLQTFLSLPITQKCQILSCDNFFAMIYIYIYIGMLIYLWPLADVFNTKWTLHSLCFSKQNSVIFWPSLSVLQRIVYRKLCQFVFRCSGSLNIGG